MTDDLDEIGFGFDGTDADAIGAMLGLPVVAQHAGPHDLPATVTAHLVLDERNPRERAVEVCRLVLAALRILPLELDVGGGQREPSAFLYAERTDPAKRAWFVRLIPDRAYLGVLGLTVPHLDGWVHLVPPTWLPYPRVWDGPGVDGFRRAVVGNVRDLVDLLEQARTGQSQIDRAGQLPGTNPN